MSYSDSLIEFADSFDLKLSSPIYQVPIYYSNNPNNANSVIDLIFLRLNLVEIDNYFILPESRYSLNYAPLIIDISITEEFIQEKQHIIIRNSKEEEKFVSELINIIGNINTSSILDKETLETTI